MKVAIVGAGPAGLVAARFLKGAGFEPVLFEQASRVGGQWRVDDTDSSVWPGMRTNTSRVTTAFSDLPHAPGTAAYPAGDEIGAYLQRYAASWELLGRARFGCRVVEVEPQPDATWCVSSRTGASPPIRETFTHVVLASGRYRRPAWPTVPGLGAFDGMGGTSHVAAYRGPGPWRGQRVLVAGHSISAVEIASELALTGADQVIVSARRHRYVLQKLIAGVPVEHRVYTRHAALAAMTFPPHVVADSFRRFIVRTCGHPAQFGAPCHDDNPFDAGFTQNQYYLPLVAEGRIVTRPWLERVDGRRVTYRDGTSDEVDAIICGTGYDLDLPFLGPTVRAALQPDAQHADLHDFTFHPDLPNFACIGLFEQSGPYFTPLELQARWVAGVWSGRCPAPTTGEMHAGVAAYQRRRGEPQVQRMHLMCALFARHAGVEPELAHWPALSRALLFGVQSPASFRLEGPDALPDAAARVQDDVGAFGALDGPTFTPEEAELLCALARARGDDHLSRCLSGLV